LIPEFDAIGLILLGFAVAVPIFIRRWSALGLVCAVGALVAGVIAGLASAGYLLAPALGVGAISALLGLIPMTATTRTKPSRVGA
jgi:Kef-type K+ transport system membrane component KefB